MPTAMPQVRKKYSLKKCAHGRRQTWCHDCGGGSICKHNGIREMCHDCGGRAICEHMRQRYRCKDCNGKGVCKHNRLRYQCGECGGPRICEHNRQRAACSECQNWCCMVEACAQLGHKFCNSQALLAHMRAFHGDNPKALTKRKELEVHQLLGQVGLQFEFQHHLPFRGCGLEAETARAFADFVLYASWGAVILEWTKTSTASEIPAATCAATLTWPQAWPWAAPTS